MLTIVVASSPLTSLVSHSLYLCFEPVLWHNKLLMKVILWAHIYGGRPDQCSCAKWAAVPFRRWERVCEKQIVCSIFLPCGDTWHVNVHCMPLQMCLGRVCESRLAAQSAVLDWGRYLSNGSVAMAAEWPDSNLLHQDLTTPEKKGQIGTQEDGVDDWLQLRLGLLWYIACWLRRAAHQASSNCHCGHTHSGNVHIECVCVGISWYFLVILSIFLDILKFLSSNKCPSKWKHCLEQYWCFAYMMKTTSCKVRSRL